MVRVAVITLIYACGSSMPIASTPEPAPPEPSPSEPPEVDRAPAWTAIVPASAPRRVGGSDGVHYVVARHYRIRVEGESVHWAPQVFATPIIDAVELGSGWLFLTQDGGVWFARTFDAAPIFRRYISGAHRLCGQRGAAIVTRAGELWTTGDGAEFTEQDVGAYVFDACWMGPDLIVAIANDALYQTERGQWVRSAREDAATIPSHHVVVIAGPPALDAAVARVERLSAAIEPPSPAACGAGDPGPLPSSARANVAWRSLVGPSLVGPSLVGPSLVGRPVVQLPVAPDDECVAHEDAKWDDQPRQC